ncbi:hypothetical protein Hanom_Chr00s036182g01772371 [Helianthus anomalus]
MICNSLPDAGWENFENEDDVDEVDGDYVHSLMDHVSAAEIDVMPTQAIDNFLEGIAPYFTAEGKFLRDKYRNSKEYRQSVSHTEPNETVKRTRTEEEWKEMIENKVDQLDKFVKKVQKLIIEAEKAYPQSAGIREAIASWDSSFIREVVEPEKVFKYQNQKYSREDPKVVIDPRLEECKFDDEDDFTCSLLQEIGVACDKASSESDKKGKKLQVPIAEEMPSFDLILAGLSPEKDDKASKMALVVHEPRPSRLKTIPEAMRSPYARKKVEISGVRTKVEENVAKTIFAAHLNKWYVLNFGVFIVY